MRQIPVIEPDKTEMVFRQRLIWLYYQAVVCDRGWRMVESKYAVTLGHGICNKALHKQGRRACRKTFTMRLDFENRSLRQELTMGELKKNINMLCGILSEVSQVKLFRQASCPAGDICFFNITARKIIRMENNV